MIHICNRGGAVIRTSRNLAGILTYARKVAAVERVTIHPADHDRQFPVKFDFFDGSYAWVFFADWRVASDWILSRRSWRWGDWRRQYAHNSGPAVAGYSPAVMRYYGSGN
jgi:hypothetical protein